MIEVKHIVKQFGQPPQTILNDISFTVNDGEFVSLIGKSGSGKTTLLYAISSLDTPTQGEVLIDGRNVYRLSEEQTHQFRNQQMGFVFQFHYLIPELTALENVLMPLKKAGRVNEQMDYVNYLFEHFDISEQQHKLPGQMSGGQQQRVAIARAIAGRPKYLFADEPTGNLDSSNAKKIMNIFQELNQQQQMTIVLVTHDPEFSDYASRKLMLKDGRLCSSSEATSYR